MGLFRKSKKQQRLHPEAAADALRKNIHDIRKRTTLLQTNCNRELQQALLLKKQGDRTRTLGCLKRRKMYETEIAKLEASALSFEQQLFAIEATSLNHNIFESLKQGSATLKGINGTATIEAMDKLRDELEQQHDQLHEINEVFSQPTGLISTLDDDELFEELKEIEADEYEEDFLEIDARANPLPHLKSRSSTQSSKRGDPTLHALQES